MISKDQARALVVLAAQPRAGLNPAYATDDDTLDAALAVYVDACGAERLDKSNLDEPLRLGDRVRVKQSGRTGVLVQSQCAQYDDEWTPFDTDGDLCLRMDGSPDQWYYRPYEIERA